MDYSQTLEYLYSALPMFQRMGGAAFHKDLKRTQDLLTALGNPENQFKSIHIAGTNGKGSCSHIIASVFQEAGYRTGLYTSPHLKEFTERIKLNGGEVSREFVVAFVAKHKSLIEKIQPSFFEMTVAMAFSYFATEKVDVAIIEVGMGGRLDSTNVITPELSVITNISLDHQQFLGNTLPQIASEKAGIIKPHIPVVIGEYSDETWPVFQHMAEETGSECIPAFRWEIEGTLSDFSVTLDQDHKYSELTSGLGGPYTPLNLRTSLVSIHLLRKNWAISDRNISDGVRNVIKNTSLKGRWQILGTAPLVICDTGHNLAGVSYTMDELRKSDKKHWIIVWGSVNDKDIEPVLNLLPKNASYIFCEPSIPRKMDAELLQQKAAQAGLTGDIEKDVNKALEKAISRAGKMDGIFVGGSTFVVAELNQL